MDQGSFHYYLRNIHSKRIKKFNYLKPKEKNKKSKGKRIYQFFSLAHIKISTGRRIKKQAIKSHYNLPYNLQSLTDNIIKSQDNQVFWAPVIRSSFQGRIRGIPGSISRGNNACACLYARAGLVVHLWWVENRCESKKKKN